MSKSLISSFLLSDVSESLNSLKSNERCDLITHFAPKNERPWAIRSGRSEEMSDVSESLISLTKNERMSESLIFLSELLIPSFFDKKQAISSEIKWANSQLWYFFKQNKFCFCNTRNNWFHDAYFNIRFC